MFLLAETALSFDYFASYGLGVVVLGVACWWLSAQLEKSRQREAEANKTVVEITRETLIGMNKLTAVIDSLSPLIGSVSTRTGEAVAQSTRDLKDHITATHTQLIAELAKREKGKQSET